MEQSDEIRITPEPPGYKPPSREALPPPPVSKQQTVNPADRRFLIILASVTIGSIALMMLVATILLFTVK